MKRIALSLAVAALLTGCMEPESDASNSKERIYIPVLNTIACQYDSVQVRESRQEFYSPAIAAKMEGCIYPYPEPKRWEAYFVRRAAVGSFMWGGAGTGDSAALATEFFNAGTFEPDWVVRSARFESTTDTALSYRQWHYESGSGPQWISGLSVRYDLTKQGFDIPSGGGVEIFILE